MNAPLPARRSRAGPGRAGACAALATCAALFLLAAPAARAQLAARPLVTAAGLAAGDGMGSAVAAAGDINGDGYDDFLVGARTADGVFADAGRAYVFLGGAHLDSVADVVVIGRTPGGHAGATLAGVGDVNGDGYGDWLVGSPDYDTGVPPRFPGKVWLYFGSANPDGISDRTFDPPAPGIQGFGIALAGVGDFNADGAPDFVISGFIAGPDTTSAFVYFGGPNLDTRPSLALHIGPRFTVRAVCSGDVNGDGWRDIIVGASGGSSAVLGRVLVYFGGPAFDGEPDLALESTAQLDNFGYALASGGDLNGDGYDDIVVGAPGRSVSGRIGAGEALVYFGGPALRPTPDLVMQGALAGDNMGGAVAIPGDLDGDGFADFVVGAPRADGRGLDSGRVFICFGGTAVDAVADLIIDGEASIDLFGTAVAGAGEPDVGGSAALLVGATLNDAGGANSGRVYLYRVSRFEISAPGVAERWTAGEYSPVRWSGADPATIAISLDDGGHWQTLATGVGGAASNFQNVQAPFATSGRARLRLTQTGAAPLAGASTLSPGLFHVTARALANPAVMTEFASAFLSNAGHLGASVAAGVDCNGDGRTDLVAGAPRRGNGAIEILPEAFTVADTLTTIVGATPLEQFGAAVANAGDLDGDGWDDLVVGAPTCAAAGADAGRVYFFRGGPASERRPRLIIEGRRRGELFGASVAAAGDVNGDGSPDLIVGAPGSSGAGLAYIFFGGPRFDAVPDVTLSAGIPGPFGLVVAGAGDVNGDGAADVLVSGPPAPGGTGAGVVHLFFGSSSAQNWKRVVLEGASIGDGFGAAIAGLGDQDGDGFADFAIGAPLADGPAADAGAVSVYFGTSRFVPRAGMTIKGSAAGEFFGASLAGGADLDGDGRPDFAVGAPGSALGGPDAGSVHVFYGGSDALRDTILLGSPRTRFGEALAVRGAGGDSLFGVLAVGAPFDGGSASVGARGLRGFAASRWSFVEPGGESSWIAGSRQSVSWRGAEPAELWFVGGDGAASRLAAAAGGSEHARVEVVVASALPDSGRLELRPPAGGPRGRTLGPRVRVRRTVRTLDFAWQARADGVALHWATDPPLGSMGVASFRLSRAARPGESETILGGASMTDTTFFDANGRAGDRYDLVAITAQGDEFSAGSLTVPAPAPAIHVWPQPAGESGEVRLSFAAPRRDGAIAQDLEVAVFDARGRRIAVLAFGRPETRAGVVELRWNGRTQRGERAGPGLYFVRARAPSAGFELTRRVVLLDTPGW